MKKILLIQPPQWYPITPHLAVPLLAGQLKAAGFDVTISDLNVKFYNRILTSAHLAAADEAARTDLAALSALYRGADFDAIRAAGTYEEKTRALKYLTLQKFYGEHGAEVPDLIRDIGLAVRTMREPALFYDPEKLPVAKHQIRLALRLASMPFAPNELDLDNYFANPLLNLDWENIKKQVHDRSVNMFYGYLAEESRAIAEKGFDIVCLSLTDLSQLLPVFTLASFLKADTGAQVVVGGNYATQICDDIVKFEEILHGYIDYISIGDGETALVALCRALDGQLALSDVPNLVYYDASEQKTVNKGFSCAHFDMNALAYPDFTGYDLGSYFTPEIIFPVQLSKGCYWGKCAFCDYAYGQQGYSPKRIPRIIDELRYFVERYGASKFIFVDEAIPPAFYNRLALAILEAGLKINYYSFARLEDGYTSEVLKNLYASGARLFLWGYECESLRIMKLMNKGINAERRLEILTDARNAGIWNDGLFIFGYPTETMEEIEATQRVIREHRREIPSVTLSNFALKKHALLLEEIGGNGVYDFAPNGDFYTVYRDKIDGVAMADRRAVRRNFQFDFLDENAHSLWSVVFSDFDHLLLYLSKYGCDYVSGYRSEKRVSPEFR